MNRYQVLSTRPARHGEVRHGPLTTWQIVISNLLLAKVGGVLGLLSMLCSLNWRGCPSFQGLSFLQTSFYPCTNTCKVAPASVHGIEHMFNRAAWSMSMLGSDCCLATLPATSAGLLFLHNLQEEGAAPDAQFKEEVCWHMSGQSEVLGAGDNAVMRSPPPVSPSHHIW